MPGGKGNIRPEDGKQFSSEYQPLNPGRKKLTTKRVIDALEKDGYETVGEEDVKRAYMLLVGMPFEELSNISNAQEKGLPAIFRITAKEILSDRGFDIIERMIDRSHGKSTQNVNVKVKNTTADEGEFTDDQLEQMRQIINGNGDSDNEAGNTSNSGKRSNSRT